MNASFAPLGEAVAAAGDKHSEVLGICSCRGRSNCFQSIHVQHWHRPLLAVHKINLAHVLVPGSACDAQCLQQDRSMNTMHVIQGVRRDTVIVAGLVIVTCTQQCNNGAEMR